MNHDADPAAAAIPPAVLELFGMLKQSEKSDGSWPGGDAVETVCTWFQKLGIDPEPEVQACPRCGLAFTEDDEDDADDAPNRLGTHILDEHTAQALADHLGVPMVTGRNGTHYLITGKREG